MTRIELFTEDPCPGEACQRCREMNAVLQEVTATGVRRVLNRIFSPWTSKPPLKVRHLACHEADGQEADLCDQVLPQLRVEGAIVLQGNWTEAQVRAAVARALDGRDADQGSSEGERGPGVAES